MVIRITEIEHSHPPETDPLQQGLKPLLGAVLCHYWLALRKLIHYNKD